MKFKNSSIIILVIVLFTTACSNNDFKIDVSDIELDLQFERFDKDFFSINPDSIYVEIPRLEEEYGDFFNLYNYEIIGVGSPEEKGYSENVGKFVNYCVEKGLVEKINTVFADDEILKNDITEAFKHYKYYFPEKKIPIVYTCISGFNQSLFTNEGYLGISLEKYLGANYKVYGQLGLEHYMKFKMHKAMIPIDCMRAWSMAEFPPDYSDNTLLSSMIYEGRVQYFLNSTLPETNDTLKWGYTYQQFMWVNKHESKIWDYLIEEKLLFTTEPIELKTFTGEAGFTSPFHRISAPRAGTWVGYQIVKSYMDSHKNVSLQELMEITDYMLIYNESRYNP